MSKSDIEETIYNKLILLKDYSNYKLKDFFQLKEDIKNAFLEINFILKDIKDKNLSQFIKREIKKIFDNSIEPDTIKSYLFSTFSEIPLDCNPIYSKERIKYCKDIVLTYEKEGISFLNDAKSKKAYFYIKNEPFDKIKIKIKDDLIKQLKNRGVEEIQIISSSKDVNRKINLEKNNLTLIIVVSVIIFLSLIITSLLVIRSFSKKPPPIYHYFGG